MGSKGAKEIVQEIINYYKIKRNGYPYALIYKLSQLLFVIEDTYSVSSAAELQEAIDSIGSGAGTIFIASGTYTIDTPIDIDGCGSYVIYGHGDNTILQAADGVSIFNITCCDSCIIKTLKLDINNYTILNPNTQAVIVNETNNNVVGFQDVTIDGDGSYGYGIELQSDNCDIINCNITDCKYGIYINNSNRHTISNNSISGCADYGIYANTGNYINISSNICQTNGGYGIYLNTVTYATISGNIADSNTDTGIYIGGSSNNTISSNGCSSNSKNGIYLTGSSYNTISGNTCNNNDSNSISSTAGIFVTANSDYNTITSNSANNNNNAGLGNGYGIRIDTANCNENVVSSNNCNGNDIDYEDEGTGTTIIYYVQTEDEIQDAIDSIGSGAGTIRLAEGTISITTSIDVDGGGLYIIEGSGDGTVLYATSNNVIFNVTNCASGTKITNLKIDGSGFTIQDDILYIDETNDNRVVLEFITLDDSSNNRVNMSFISDNIVINKLKVISANRAVRLLGGSNCIVSNCIIEDVSYAIESTGEYNKISDNKFNSITNIAIYINTDHNFINDNLFTSVKYPIQVFRGDYNNISNNIIDSCNTGIYLYTLGGSTSNKNVIRGNIITNGTGLGTTNFAGIYLGQLCSYNVITNNNIVDCTDATAYDYYGISINNANSQENIIQGNTNSGNDVQYLDNGTNTRIIYICSSNIEIQDAIDSIGSGNGIIKMNAGNITITTAITFNNANGEYIFEGAEGGTTLVISGEITCIDIQDANNIILRNFSIDASGLANTTTNIIAIDSDNVVDVVIENINITGDGTNGIGIYTSPLTAGEPQ